jgi:hypothetical protein
LLLFQARVELHAPAAQPAMPPAGRLAGHPPACQRQGWLFARHLVFLPVFPVHSRSRATSAQVRGLRSGPAVGGIELTPAQNDLSAAAAHRALTARGLLPPLLLAALASCVPSAKPAPPAQAGEPAISCAPAPVNNGHVPAFATVPFEPFRRIDAVAIAQREWRVFGQPVDDDPPDTHPHLPEDLVPERKPGLWQRVGEYWWEGIDAGTHETAWTGMHDENGTTFELHRDSDFAWSAAFISYIMRIAGAGTRFPYSAHHWTYINAAVRGEAPALRAYPINQYAPQPGDLICTGRDRAAKIRFANLPAPPFPAHCDIVIDAAAGTLTVLGGNVDDAVTAKHVPIAPSGLLAGPGGKPLDPRYNWFTVLAVQYDGR